MERIKNIAIVAHDNCKKTMLEFVENQFDILVHHNLFGTGTTGGLVEELLQKKCAAADSAPFCGVHKMKSGPLGGDQQLGGLIADGKIDVLIFFWDPMEPQPHDVDVKALLRLAVLYNIPTASNLSSAEFLISSPLFKTEYEIRDAGFMKK